MSDFVLTDDNYYSTEANKHFLSCSQYDDYMTCEAAALAKEQGFYIPKESKAFALGKYFHAALEGEEAFGRFCDENFNDIFKTRELKSGDVKVTGKYADYETIDNMIRFINEDPVIKRYIEIPGQNEVSMTGNLFGMYPWKIRLDKLIRNPEMIVDWKTLGNIYETQYDADEGERVPFTVSYGYYTRAAVYMEIYKQFTGKDIDPLFYLICVSKQDPPDKEIVMMNERQRLDLELDKLYETLPRIWRVKTGVQKPDRCGTCAYCRSTKRISGSIMAYELRPDSRPPKEQEYDDLWNRYTFVLEHDDAYKRN